MALALVETGINYKFAKGLRSCDPSARIFRKSGSWQTFHADSALVEHDGRSYVAVALANSPQGNEWMSQLIVAADETQMDGVVRRQCTRRQAGAAYFAFLCEAIALRAVDAGALRTIERIGATTEAERRMAAQRNRGPAASVISMVRSPLARCWLPSPTSCEGERGLQQRQALLR